MTNPAGVKRQVIGVFDGNLNEQIASVLKRLGSERIFVVHGKEGLDEISISGETIITELRRGEIITCSIIPEDYGFKRRPITEVTGSYPEDNKNIALEILRGKKCAGREMVLLNAGFAIAVSDDSLQIAEGIEQAKESLDSGKALKKLEQLIKITNTD
jgi:anthranilate phosphoribosyltransferase